jgi:hypothetical protein
MQLNPKIKERILILRTLMLDGRDKARMRDALSAYVDLHEMPARAVRSPYFSYVFSRSGSGVLAFVLILLVGGSGAAYAAEGSVPGSPLYPVKVSLIEPVQGALITSAEGQASWHADLASRRLEEATQLAVANKLDSKTQEYLQTKFNTEVDTSNKDADVLAATGNTDAALDARSELEAKITAHAEILAAVDSHLATTASSTDTGTKKLLASVQKRRVEALQARLALEDSARTHNADTTVAVAMLTHTKAAPKTMNAEDTPSQENARTEKRSTIEASILLQHAGLLRSLTPASTTASTTATTTTATTTQKNFFHL